MEEKALSKWEKRFNFDTWDTEDFIWLILGYMLDAKANIFKKFTFENKDVNTIFKRSNGFSKLHKAVRICWLDTFVGIVTYQSEITGKTNFKLARIVNYEREDDFLTYINCINPEIEINDPTVKKWFNEEYKYLINEKKVKYIYSSNIKETKDNNTVITTEILQTKILDLPEIPVTILFSDIRRRSLFMNTKYLFELILDNVRKIKDDLDVGTTKVPINARAVPHDRRLAIKNYKELEKKYRKSFFIDQEHIIINEQTQQMQDKIYGSLQGDQLFYIFKSAWQLALMVLEIYTNNVTKGTAQQNNLERTQENKLWQDSVDILKVYWEEQLVYLSRHICLVEKNIVGNNIIITKNKVTIKTMNTIEEKVYNKDDIKKEFGKDK